MAYNDCIRGSGDTTAENVTNWTIYNGFTSNTSGSLINVATGQPTPVTATFTWNTAAGLRVSESSGSEDGIPQPRPGTDAYDVFGGIVDFSRRLIYYGSEDWWVEITFTGLDPDQTYSFVTTAIRAENYPTRFSLFTLSGHKTAVNNSSDGVYIKNGPQTVLVAAGNHLNTTGYVVRWDAITVADDGSGTGSFTVRAEAIGTDYKAYPFGGFMLAETGNNEPVVDAGPDRTIHSPLEYLTLAGTVTDDGLGSPNGFLQSTWSQLWGPAPVEFVTDSHQPEVTVRFPAIGEYELQLAATDGERAAADTVHITVTEPVCPVGDIDGDCIVRLADLSLLGGAWLDTTDASPADLDGDATVDMTELNLLAQSWLRDWTGAVQVTIMPVEAALAGAQWRIDDGPWHYSGQTAAEVPQGSHTIEYDTLTGWVRPDAQPVTVTRGRTAAVTSNPYRIPDQVLAISEFMAVNSNITDLRPQPSIDLYTIVNGRKVYDDWIEIQNLTDEPVELAGWSLTDNPDNRTKWTFPPATVIPARGFLVVYASNKDAEKYGYPFVDDTGHLHTNFELAGGGEYLALVAPDGEWVVDEYDDYPAQRGLVTYGVGSDDRIGYLQTVTRGAENTGTVYDGRVADTKFSVDRGFYDAPIAVAVTCDTPDAVIRYTTDASTPTASHGIVYTGPITIDTTTCLRAAAFKSGWLASNVDTQTYLFLDNVLAQATDPYTWQQVIPDGYPTIWPGGKHSGAVTGDYQVDPDIAHPDGMFGHLYAAALKDDLKDIPSMSIVAPVDSLFGPTGIYINENQDGTERAGSVELLDPTGQERFQIDCGLRMQGGAGEDNGGTTLNRWKSYKLSFRLVFRGLYGGQLDYPLFGPGAADSYDTVVLDCRPQNSWLHPDGTQRLHGEYVRDQVAADTQLALGGYAPHGRPLHLYINGMYWGMYWLHERPDDAFAASYLGGDKDDYDVLKHDAGNVISGSNEDYFTLFGLPANSPDEVTAFENLQQKLDVPDFIDYLLANYYIGNGDWDHKNWYASRSRFDPDGRWRWHMWDGEHIMDDGSFPTTDVTGKNNEDAPTGLHWKWIGNDEYRLAFADRVNKHFYHDGALTPANFAALFTRLTDWIDRAVVAESARWGDNRRSTPYTRNAEWLTEVNRLLTDFIPSRRNVVLNQFAAKNPKWYPATAAPEFYIDGDPQYGGDAPRGAALTLTTGGNPVWYTLDGADPRLPGGAVNTASAAAYGSGLALDKAEYVRARARSAAGEWSALAEAVFSTDPLADSLRVTELMYHPADPNLEFVELINIGPDPVNLNWVRLADGLDHTFGPQPLDAGGFLLLVKNKSAFEAVYTALPAGVPVLQWDAGALDNKGETLRLDDPLGRPILAFGYKDGWYPLTDGDGFSLTVIDPLADPILWDQKEGWRASTAAGGSPGQDDSGLAPNSIVINELLAHSHDTLPDWIELHNTTAQPLNIGGWFLSDTDDDYTRYTIPENTQIPAGGYVVFYEDTHFGTAFALSENGETLYLTSGSGGQITGCQAAQPFDASERAVALGRYVKASTGDMDFVAMKTPTPGAANAAPQVGPVVISQIQYHPADDNDGDEYIQLHNISDATVYLQDLAETESAPGVFANEIVPWAFTDGIDFTFPLGTAIAPGGCLVVAKDPAALTAFYTDLPPGTPVFGPFENDTSLSNGGEKLRLCRPGERLFAQDRAWIRVDQVTYDDANPWPATPDGAGHALHRSDPAGYGNDPANWTAATPDPGR